MAGNNAQVDAYGFIHPGREGHFIESLTAHVFVPTMGGDSATSIRQGLVADIVANGGAMMELDNDHDTTSVEHSNNWVTDRWDKVVLVWIPGVSDSDSMQAFQTQQPIRKPHNVYVRCSFDEWNWEPMKKRKDGRFECMRMCPPGYFEYSFVCEFGAKVGEPLVREQKYAADQKVTTYTCTTLPESAGGLQYAYAEQVLVTTTDNFEARISRPLHMKGVSDGTEVVRDRLDAIKAAAAAKLLAAEGAALEKGKGKGKAVKDAEGDADKKKVEGPTAEELAVTQKAAAEKAEAQRRRLALPGVLMQGGGRMVNTMYLKPRRKGETIPIPPRSRGAAQEQHKQRMKKVY
jgi:hypothetical protein